MGRIIRNYFEQYGIRLNTFLTSGETDLLVRHLFVLGYHACLFEQELERQRSHVWKQQKRIINLSGNVSRERCYRKR